MPKRRGLDALSAAPRPFPSTPRCRCAPSPKPNMRVSNAFWRRFATLFRLLVHTFFPPMGPASLHRAPAGVQPHPTQALVMTLWTTAQQVEHKRWATAGDRGRCPYLVCRGDPPRLFFGGLRPGPRFGGGVVLVETLRPARFRERRSAAPGCLELDGGVICFGAAPRAPLGGWRGAGRSRGALNARCWIWARSCGRGGLGRRLGLGDGA